MIAENGGNIPWTGFDAPTSSPPRTPRSTIRPASHFKCTICARQAVRRVAGPNAMPHNVGRAFYKCRNAAHGSYFCCEDSRRPVQHIYRGFAHTYVESITHTLLTLTSPSLRFTQPRLTSCGRQVQSLLT
jgi:hypothetical protein